MGHACAHRPPERCGSDTLALTWALHVTPHVCDITFTWLQGLVLTPIYSLGPTCNWRSDLALRLCAPCHSCPADASLPDDIDHPKVYTVLASRMMMTLCREVLSM